MPSVCAPVLPAGQEASCPRLCDQPLPPPPLWTRPRVYPPTLRTPHEQGEAQDLGPGKGCRDMGWQVGAGQGWAWGAGGAASASVSWELARCRGLCPGGGALAAGGRHVTTQTQQRGRGGSHCTLRLGPGPSWGLTCPACLSQDILVVGTATWAAGLMSSPAAHGAHGEGLPSAHVALSTWQLRRQTWTGPRRWQGLGSGEQRLPRLPVGSEPTWPGSWAGQGSEHRPKVREAGLGGVRPRG